MSDATWLSRTADRLDLEPRAPRHGWTLLLAIAAMVAAFLGWAATALIDEVAVVPGQIVPARQMQVVQSLEGGIVREILVKEGAVVEEDAVLMRIDDTSFASRLGEVSQRQSALQAEIVRLEAEAAGKASVVFSPALRATAPSSVKAETETFAARRSKLDGELSQLTSQLRQREQELQELGARRRKIDAELGPLRSELGISQQLARTGNVARVEVLRLQRQVAELEGEAKVLAAAVPRTDAAIAEAKTRIASATTAFRSAAIERLGTLRSDLAVLEETLKGAQDRVTRTTVKSPVRGTVNKLAVATIGAVVQPGQPLADIVPADDALLVEVRIRPKDVGFVAVGQRASVKFTAYDYVTHGMMPGRVERLAPNTVRDERGEPYYLAIVRTDRAYLGTAEKPLPLVPGMLANVDIRTGERTVLSYLVRPFIVLRREALRER